ncbi:hypothetical protein KAR91_41785 [Candidatus Pacearchaeota archaeon]|nr:hypothetical protein [Candidatus Pacearchaeota archaeon]
MQTKPWYQSRLLWVGAIQLMTAALNASLENGATWVTITLSVLGVATVVLRTQTTTRLSR